MQLIFSIPYNSHGIIAGSDQWDILEHVLYSPFIQLLETSHSLAKKDAMLLHYGTISLIHERIEQTKSLLEVHEKI